MSSETDPSAASSFPFSSASTLPRPYSSQGHAAEQAIAAAGRVVEQILGDAALLSLLATRGVDSAQVQRGASLHILAQQSCEECQMVLGALDAAEAARAIALAASREDYRDFRRAVKAACANDNCPDPLEAGAARQSLRSFVVHATASYLAALKTLPPALIAEHGFDLSRTNAALARVQRLVVLDTLFNTRTRHASRRVHTRDRCVARLNSWTGELLDVVQNALGQAGTVTSSGPWQKKPTHPSNDRRRPRPIAPHPARFAIRFFGTQGG